MTPPIPRPIPVVVVAVDGGPHSDAAFHRAAKVFPIETTDFRIVHVRPDHTQYRLDKLYSPGFELYWDELEDSRKKESQDILEKYRAWADQAGLKHFETVELEGDPREAICEYCRLHEAEILVVGSRGTGLLREMFLGSVSTYCSHHAPCNVMIEKGNDHIKATTETTSPALAA